MDHTNMLSAIIEIANEQEQKDKLLQFIQQIKQQMNDIQFDIKPYLEQMKPLLQEQKQRFLFQTNHLMEQLHQLLCLPLEQVMELMRLHLCNINQM